MCILCSICLGCIRLHVIVTEAVDSLARQYFHIESLTVCDKNWLRVQPVGEISYDTVKF